MEMQEVLGRLVAVEERSKSNSHRLDALEKQTEAINRLATSVEVMTVQQKAIAGQVTEMSAEVKELKAEPGKRWRFVVEKAIYVVVSAVVGFVLAKAGIS